MNIQDKKTGKSAKFAVIYFFLFFAFLLALYFVFIKFGADKNEPDLVDTRSKNSILNKIQNKSVENLDLSFFQGEQFNSLTKIKMRPKENKKIKIGNPNPFE